MGVFRRRKRDKGGNDRTAPDTGQKDASARRARAHRGLIAARRLAQLHSATPPPNEVPGRGMSASYMPALSNMQFDIEYQTIDGLDVATRWTTSGNLMTDLHGIPGNGQPVTIRGITITSFLGATVRRESTYWNFQELDEHITRILEPS